MNGPVRRGKPSLLEAGLPCAFLSAECQRDNNARQRPPQNRLHIWWARRPPTVCRAAILGALLPFDLDLPKDVLPAVAPEPSEEDLDELPRKMLPHRAFFERLLKEVPATLLSKQHRQFLKALGVAGDSDRAYRRMALREEYQVGSSPILLPMNWTYRHEPAFTVSPSDDLLVRLSKEAASALGLSNGEIVVADHMAGGGAIPIEAVRYGYRVFANELNPVAAVTLKATIEYPARFGSALSEPFQRYEQMVEQRVRERLLIFFHTEPPEVWWPEESQNARLKFSSRQIEKREPAQRNSRKNCNLWARLAQLPVEVGLVPCSNCALNIPLSTNFHIIKKKGKPEQDLAAFPQVPPRGRGNDCTFRIVHRDEWAHCRWPRPDFERWNPIETPTFKDGKAICPRCGHIMDGDEVKAVARSRESGLASQLYAVCSQVPVKLTYRDGKVKTRWLWRFRAPRKEDLDAIAAAEAELRHLLPKWEAKGLVPMEEIPEGDKTREPRNMGIVRFRDFFLPRQLLTNLVILEEIRGAQERAKAELPADQAEAVGVYLAFILEIRSSAPIHTEAESSLNIRGLDAARSTILLLCLPHEEKEQPVGNWATVQARVGQIAAGAAAHFQEQGLAGTDLYLSALGPALGEVVKNWPVTDFAGRPINLIDALEEAYRAVGRWRLSQIFTELTARSDIGSLAYGFSAEAVDRDTQTLWLWLDTFLGEQASSDDVRKLAKSLNADPDDFKQMSLLSINKDTFVLHPPQEVDLKRVSRRLLGESAPAGRAGRAADIWEERTFPGFVGAAVWNAIAMMVGTEDVAGHGVETLKRWLRTAGYCDQPEFIGAFAVTLDLLERVFGKRPETSPWGCCDAPGTSRVGSGAQELAGISADGIPRSPRSAASVLRPGR